VRTKIWATFSVSIVLMLFFSYALFAAGKKVYQQKKETPDFVVLQAQSAYISKEPAFIEENLTLTALSPLALGYKLEGMRHCLIMPTEKVLQKLQGKTIDATLTYFDENEVSRQIFLREPIYNPYKEEVTFVISGSTIGTSERLSEPVLLFKANPIEKKRSFFSNER
jgi:hypothetical protein